MEERFRVEFINRTGRAIRTRTDIGDNAIPSGEMAKVSMRPASVVEAFDAREKREVRIAIVPNAN